VLEPIQAWLSPQFCARIECYCSPGFDVTSLASAGSSTKATLACNLLKARLLSAICMLLRDHSLVCLGVALEHLIK
jgi:hypothetical protein